MVQFSHQYMTTGKTTALTIWTLVGKVMSLLFNILSRFVRLPRWLNSKKSACKAGQPGAMWVRFLGGGNGNPLQYSCLENPTDRGASWATVHGVAKSWIQLKQQHTRTSRFVIAFLPRNQRLLISWLQSLSTVILAPQNKVCHYFHFFPHLFAWTDGTGYHDLHFWVLSFKPAFFTCIFSLIFFNMTIKNNYCLYWQSC